MAGTWTCLFTWGPCVWVHMLQLLSHPALQGACAELQGGRYMAHVCSHGAHVTCRGGGGAALCGDRLRGASRVLRPDHAAVANAVGAAVPQVDVPLSHSLCVSVSLSSALSLWVCVCVCVASALSPTHTHTHTHTLSLSLPISLSLSLSLSHSTPSCLFLFLLGIFTANPLVHPHNP